MSDMSNPPFPMEAAGAANLRLLQDVDVKLTVEIGSTSLKLRELLSLGEASVVELDRQANELLDVLVNGTLIGRGEVVTIGDRFGIRITELADPRGRAVSPA
ncbi:flagellar motor switch protein FliN [Sphingomonas sp. ID0503]|uniref:flagellar motor switch protein FliN n=1 Tax=Sphingomonas sp. ID0503 TaxID=3399691 RepID=UPI003AFB7D92